jgi:hypothetical protein
MIEPRSSETPATAKQSGEQAPLSRQVLALRTIAFRKSAQPRALANAANPLRLIHSRDKIEQ